MNENIITIIIISTFFVLLFQAWDRLDGYNVSIKMITNNSTTKKTHNVLYTRAIEPSQYSSINLRTAFLLIFQRKKFWFATGGAGFCLSHALVARMSPHIR